VQIAVTGKKLDIGESLKNHVEDRLSSSVSKFFEKAIDSNVVFSKEAHNNMFRADVIVNEGTGSGIVIKSNGLAADVYAAFDMAADRIEKQLRRYKRKIKNHHKKKFSELEAEGYKQFAAKKYVLSEKDEGEELQDEDAPLIIAEKPVKIETLTVSEAVMQMNLQNLPALMFINKGNSALNVVYHRIDGNISWIDPERAK